MYVINCKIFFLYQFGKPLGAGVSGTVYAGVYKPTGTKVAIKVKIVVS